MRIFNVQTEVSLNDLDIPNFLYFDLTQWVSHDTATEEERSKYAVEIETCGGFLKTIDYKIAFQRAWSNASEDDREKVKALPHFDADVFYEISGVRV